MPAATLAFLHAPRLSLVYAGQDGPTVSKTAPDRLVKLGSIRADKKIVDAFLLSIDGLRWFGSWYIATDPLLAAIRSKQLAPVAHRIAGQASKGDARNLLDETVVSLYDGKRHPKIRRAYRTLRRYARVGAENRRTGETILLETIIMPNAESTSVEAYQRFLAALQ